MKFESLEVRNEILYSDLFTLNNRPMMVNVWTPNFNFHDEIMRAVPLWVRFPNLPLNCWDLETLSRIGSMVGVPLFADECTTRQKRVSFARFLIKVDVTKPVSKVVYIEDAQRTVVEPEVHYDWIPPYCHKCQTAGYDYGKKRHMMLQELKCLNSNGFLKSQLM